MQLRWLQGVSNSPAAQDWRRTNVTPILPEAVRHSTAQLKHLYLPVTVTVKKALELCCSSAAMSYEAVTDSSLA